LQLLLVAITVRFRYHVFVSRQEKLIRKFLDKPNDFKWSELTAMLRGFGFKAVKGKKTGGSRARFAHPELPPIILHRPHPSSILKRYQVAQIENFLKEEGLL